MHQNLMHLAWTCKLLTCGMLRQISAGSFWYSTSCLVLLVSSFLMRYTRTVRLKLADPEKKATDRTLVKSATVTSFCLYSRHSTDRCPSNYSQHLYTHIRRTQYEYPNSVVRESEVVFAALVDRSQGGAPLTLFTAHYRASKDSSLISLLSLRFHTTSLYAGCQ